MASAQTRFGFFTLLTLLGTVPVAIACTSFLCFLWWGTIENDIWCRIILNNWASRAITLTSTALRIAITIQGGVCISMLAALALENSTVPLASVCSVSLMRVGWGSGLLSTLKAFVYPVLSGSTRPDPLLLPAVLLTLTLANLSQFISTALLSDVTIRLVPGYNQTVNINYDFAYKSMLAGYNYTLLSPLPLWGAGQPSLWPMFAEYSEPPMMQEGISDTGVSLRAFLPLGAQDRQLVRNYSGKALVLDSRVTCQRPNLEDLEPQSSGSLRGSVTPSTSTPRLDNPDTVPFQCDMSWTLWGICELNENAILNNSAPYFSGGLVSEFRSFPLSPGQNKSGAAFLLFSPPNSSLIPTLGTEFVSTEIMSGNGYPTQIALSLCYTSLDVADRWIDAYSDTNRTEPSLAWLADDYDLKAVATQLDTGYNTSPSSSLPSVEERGIMQLQPPVDWAAPQSDQPSNDGPGTVISPASPQNLPFLTWRLHLRPSDPDSTVLGGELVIVQETVGSGDWLTAGNSFPCDVWLVRLFEHFLKNNSTSIALQAVITSLAGIEYYSRLNQFDKSDDMSIVSFVDVYTPGGPFGQKRATLPWGLGAVIILLVIHTILVIVVTMRFWTQANISRIGDDWQAIAQVALSNEGDVKNGLEKAKKLESERDVVKDYTRYVYLSKNTGVVQIKQSNGSGCGDEEYLELIPHSGR